MHIRLNDDIIRLLFHSYTVDTLAFNTVVTGVLRTQVCIRFESQHPHVFGFKGKNDFSCIVCLESLLCIHRSYSTEIKAKKKMNKNTHTQIYDETKNRKYHMNTKTK